MDNPEEVLQALDEFQKMRPSEIPRELEDYLCWVAKTGDPVYQWSLIKALFREKLLRVMTEFYESCPSLDLTPCPNVEPFNYDSMKRNLLERLEGFVNAPFTVQRICELLTAPRKEYSRVDKFMRAIEKNILVVSTKEPGPFGRRSENGDNLVNGSVEDEISHHQPANDIEMDNWVKDCAAASSLAAQSGVDDDEEMPDENGLKASLNRTYDKTDKVENEIPIDDSASTSFEPSVSDFPATTSLPEQLPVQETLKELNSDISPDETAAIVKEVSDSIMNEDTSSQPSLGVESDDSSSSDSRPLQTTFDSKDFKLDDVENPDSNSQSPEAGTSEIDIGSVESSKECDQVIQSVVPNEECSDESKIESVSSDKVDNAIIHSAGIEVDKVDQELNDKPQVSDPSDGDEKQKPTSVLPITENIEKNEIDKHIMDQSATSDGSKSDPITENQNMNQLLTKNTENIETALPHSENLVEELSTDTLDAIIKPIVEEDLPETPKLSDVETKKSETAIDEATEGDFHTSDTVIQKSVPVVEEPQDTKSVIEKSDEPSNLDPVTSKSDDPSPAIDNGSVEYLKKIEETDDSSVALTACSEIPSSKELTEWMDIDDQNLVSNVQSDEPMEHEITETLNS